MQKYLYLIIISFSLVSCYTYQVKKQANTATDIKPESKKSAVAANIPPMQTKGTTAELQSLNLPQGSAPINVQERLAPNKNVRIDVDGKTYKVIVDK